jgi:RimJ/RimL family protein N-acetyltransferase
MTLTVEGEVARGDFIVLREKRLSDAEDDFGWRTDAELSRFDAARPFASSFEDYLQLFKDELAYPSPYRRTLSIEDAAGRHIGNVMYYNIDTIRREAEIGITIGDRSCWGKGLGADAVRTLVRHIFRSTGFRRIYLKTLDWNVRAQRCFESAGFRHCGRSRRGGNSFIVMEYISLWAELER